EDRRVRRKDLRVLGRKRAFDWEFLRCYTLSMFTKEAKKYLAFPQKKKGKRGPTFFELASRHFIKGKKARANRNLSMEVDKVVYGI
ncbi:MAG: hypothetical protein AAB699_01225, partial [Patescibacteria group bacterium]